jgi:hypothetical protein
MTYIDSDSDQFIVSGLERLQQEAFGSSGFAVGMDEVVATLVHRSSTSSWHGTMKSGSAVTYLSGAKRFSRDAWNAWLDECRLRSYEPGKGTWTTAEVRIFPNLPGRVEFFDEERLERDPAGDWYPGEHPAGAATWAKELLRYPRTAGNIPSWMWNIFRSEGVTPPIYNPEFESVDWNNRRRPVTERGTDFTVEPTVIDPSLEPGVFARIGKKLFGG